MISCSKLEATAEADLNFETQSEAGNFGPELKLLRELLETQEKQFQQDRISFEEEM